MYGIMEIAKEFNTSKLLILRAAVNIGIYNPINDKKTFFTNKEKKEIFEELNKILEEKKNNLKLLKKHSNNFIDISKKWKNTLNLQTKKIKFKYNAIDLFSGAGGIALGLISEGFKPIVSSEIFKEALETYNFNLEQFIGHFSDYLNINDLDIINKKIRNKIETGSNLDLIIGGFPCQGFSVAGIRSKKDPRNMLFNKMFELVKLQKPKIVVMENVVGILSAKIDNKTFLIDHICKIYESIGYNIDYAVLNAADYGVPQLRKRVFLIANNIGIKNCFPKPILEKERYITTEEALKKFENWTEKYDSNHIFTKHKKETILKIKKLKSGQSLYKTFSDAWKRLDPNSPSGTIKENHGGVNIHYSQNRVLTPREMAALQSFPDEFIFKGKKNKQLIQIGNSVPPLLSVAIAKCVKYMLEQENDTKN